MYLQCRSLSQKLLVRPGRRRKKQKVSDKTAVVSTIDTSSADDVVHMFVREDTDIQQSIEMDDGNEDVVMMDDPSDAQLQIFQDAFRKSEHVSTPSDSHNINFKPEVPEYSSPRCHSTPSDAETKDEEKPNHDITSPIERDKRWSEAIKSLRHGCTEAEKELVLNLAMRGYEPLVPRAWEQHFPSFPKALFASDDEVPPISTLNEEDLRGRSLAVSVRLLYC